MTLVFIWKKAGSTYSIYQAISQLTVIAPADPAVKKLVEKYTQRVYVESVFDTGKHNYK